MQTDRLVTATMHQLANARARGQYRHPEAPAETEEARLTSLLAMTPHGRALLAAEGRTEPDDARIDELLGMTHLGRAVLADRARGTR